MRTLHTLKLSSALRHILKNLRSLAVIVVLANTVGVSARAALIAYEGFDYPNGVDLSGQNGGTGWITPWGVNSSGTTTAGNSPGDTNIAGSFGYVDAVGNILVTNGGHGFYSGSPGTSQPFRDFALTGAGRGTDGTTTWISMLMIRSGPTSEGANIYPRGANVSFFEGNTERFGVGNASGAPDNFICLIQAGSLPNRRPTTIPFNQISFAVLRIDHLPGNDNAYLFINPSLSAEPDISTANAQTIGLFSYTFNRARPFAGNTDTANNRPYAEISVDELRIGETWADVTPHIPGIAPGKNVIWVGNINGDWNTTTANWRTNGGPDATYADGDFVRFDDTATGQTNISLVGNLRPTSVTVSNELLQYRFTGSGQLAAIGGLIKSGAGVLTFDNSGANTVGGGVLIEAGTVQLGSGGANGSLDTANITNNGALIIDRSGSLTVNSAITGSGSLTKRGTGTLVLSGASSYAGNTEVNGGTLLLNSTLTGGGPLTTAAGTTLGGNGSSSGSATIGGLVYPGAPNAAGTLTVGSATFSGGATLQFDLNNVNTVGAGVNDLLQVNGDITPANNSIAVNFIGYPQTGVPYRLINYSGLTFGTFNPVVTGTHYVVALDELTPGQVNVTLSGSGASLKWKSTSSAVWDLGTTANWLNTLSSTPDVFYAGDSVLFDDSVVGVVTNVSLGSGVAAAPTAVTVNSAQNYTLSGAGKITGPATVLKQGTGTLTISNANDFTGGVTISDGILKAGTGTALGTGAAGTTINGTGTLDVNGQNLTAEAVTVGGQGAGNKGAIVNNGSEQQSAVRTLTVSGDVTFGGTGRWDIRNTGGNATIATGGGPYNITKIGTNQISLVAVSTIDNGLTDIDIREGMFAIQTTTTQVGNPSGTITVRGGATLGVWNLNSTPLNKLMTFEEGAILLNENGRSVINGQGNLLGMLTINSLTAGTTPALVLNGSLDGSGGFTKIGTGPLVLNNLHFYGGATVVSNGTLFVEGQIAASSAVTVYGGTLGGAGTVGAPIIIAAGGTLSPGTSNTLIGTFTGGSTLSLAGTNIMDVNKAGTTITSDLITGIDALTYGGTLRLNLTGAALTSGDVITLYSFNSASGAFASITPATPATGLVWDTSQLRVNGTLRVVPPPHPRVNSIVASGSNLNLSGTNGLANATYRVLSSTNVALPTANWPPFATNTFDANGNFSFSAPIDPSTPQRFFLLVLP